MTADAWIMQLVLAGFLQGLMSMALLSEHMMRWPPRHPDPGRGTGGTLFLRVVASPPDAVMGAPR